MSTPDWKGLFEWSMKYQDGTAQQGPVRPLSADDRAWFEEAVKHYTVNVSQHMVKIKAELESQTESDTAALLQKKEDLLDELLEIVENIDNAKDLTSIGGVETLMALMRDPEPSLRWRAAEVAATCAQNNPPVQEWLLKAGCLPKLLRLLEDGEPTCRQKGLLAISCLVRNNTAATDAFVSEDGIDWLVKLLREDLPKTQRKALQLLGALARSVPQRLPSKQLLPLAIQAVHSETMEIREAALILLLRMSAEREALQTLQKDEAFVRSLEEGQAKLALSSKEDEALIRDEQNGINQLLMVIRGGRTNAELNDEPQQSSQTHGAQERKPLLLLQ